MRADWYWLTRSGVTCAVCVVDGIIAQAPPYLKRVVGKDWDHDEWVNAGWSVLQMESEGTDE